MENGEDVQPIGRKVLLKELLISAVESRPLIWDRRGKETRNRCEFDAQWEEVAQIVQRPKSECKRQWKYLMDQYRVLHTASLTKKSEGDLHDNPVIKWAFYKPMSFMADVIDRRSCTCKCMGDSYPSSVFASVVEIDSEERLVQTPETSNGQSLFVDGQENESVMTAPEITDIMSLAANQHQEDHNDDLGTTSSCEVPCAKRSKKSSKLAAETQLIIARLGYIQKELEKEKDGCSLFCNYLKYMMKRLDPQVQRKCESQILKLVNAYLDGDTPYVVCADHDDDDDSDETVRRGRSTRKSK